MVNYIKFHRITLFSSYVFEIINKVGTCFVYYQIMLTKVLFALFYFPRVCKTVVRTERSCIHIRFATDPVIFNACRFVMLV